MTPKQILLMRHAEKPDDPTDPHLSDAGRARAEKVADYVPKNPGVPDFLCASAPSKHSVRPIETITPLSKKIGVSIDSTIADQDCPVLAFGLGAAGANVPNPWDPNVFNLILNLDYSKGSKPGRNLPSLKSRSHFNVRFFLNLASERFRSSSTAGLCCFSRGLQNIWPLAIGEPRSLCPDDASPKSSSLMPGFGVDKPPARM